MIAYNKTFLRNLRLLGILRQDLKAGKITGAEFNAITERYPVGFYTPGIWVRVGLFILTFVIILFSGGLLSLMLLSGGVVGISALLIFLGICCYVAAELLINAKNHLRSGADDALIFFSALQIVIGFAVIFSGPTENYLPLSITIFITCLLLAMRFMDIAMTTISCLALFSAIFFALERTGGYTSALAPFAVIATAVPVNLLLNRLKNNAQLIDYQNCFVAARVVCLLVFYAAGNFWVVSSLGEQFNGAAPKGPVTAFFWAWTFIIPFAYMGFGIKRKDAVLIRIALILIAATVLTFRNYYHVMSAGAALTIAGGLILIIVYAITKYLKQPKHGFTLAELDQKNLGDHLNIEALVVAQTFAGAKAPKSDGVEFGGGDFGGGGSSAGF